VPKSTTLDDLEGPLCTLFKKHAFSDPITKIWMKIGRYYQRRRCSPMTLDSGNIRFMRIFARVPCRRGGVKQQWGNWKRGFSGFRTLRLRHLRKWGQHCYIVLFSPLSALSPVHWLQNTRSLMILNGLNGHFTLNFHYYELPLRVVIYLFTVQSVYIHTRDLTYCIACKIPDTRVTSERCSE